MERKELIEKGFVQIISKDYNLNLPNHYLDINGNVYDISRGVFLPTNARGYYSLKQKDGWRVVKKEKLINIFFFKPDLTGFKEIPGFSGYLINNVGTLWSKWYHKFATPFHDKKNTGYLFFLLNDNNGNRKRRSVHHLVLMTFKPEEYRKVTKGFGKGMGFGQEEDRFVTDHRDGNKLNNHVDNLEVVPVRENIIRSIDLGLSTYCRPLSIRNYLTGEIIKFNSISRAAKFFKIDEKTMAYRMNKPNYKNLLWKGYWQGLWEGDGEWGEVTGVLAVGTGAVPIMVRDFKVSPHHFKIYFSVKDYLLERGYRGGNFLRELLKDDIDNHPITPLLEQIKRLDDFSEWRDPIDPLLELENDQLFGKRQIGVYVAFKEDEIGIAILPGVTTKDASKNKSFLNEDRELGRLSRNYDPKKGFYKGYCIMRYYNYIKTDHYKRFKKVKIDKTKLKHID